MRMHGLEFVRVVGTGADGFPFGAPTMARRIRVADFHIASVAATEWLWTEVMGTTSPAAREEVQQPAAGMSWLALTGPEGFLDRLNRSELRRAIAGAAPFRLPSEAEWEYAARGGPAWTDAFTYSGSNDIDAVAWYDANSGRLAHAVAQKAPNQLGLFDMSGNVWEWCQDHFTRDVNAIPLDGTPFLGPGDRRILRGGCSHNWAIHCTVAKRYEIEAAHGDSDIGFRLAF